MQEQGFKAWLESGGANKRSCGIRTYAVRTIEKNLSALGLPWPDLESAWKEDRFERLRQKLNQLNKEAANGGTGYRILMPHSKSPRNRLVSWRSWLGQYGQFLNGDPRGDRDADRIRRYVLERYIENARERDAESVEVLVRDVNDALSLNQAWPNICQALVGRKFLEMADVASPEVIGANQSSATRFLFRLNGTGGGSGEQDSRPFVLFDAAGEEFWPEKNTNQKSGQLAFRVKPRGATNKTEDALEVEAIADVARAVLVDGLAARMRSSNAGSDNYLTYGKRLVRYVLDPAVARQIGVAPTGDISLGGSAELDKNSPPNNEVLQTMTRPTNVIFYGPPGTGKTYATAAEAVRLCGESVPKDRAELMAIYRRLSEAGRIEFLTFHQSTSYEDFVEGLRPKQSNENGAAGFELEPVQGVFRRIARRAETTTGASDNSFTIGERQIFKMSIGEAANPEDAYLFEEAIAGGYTLLNWDSIDWSDERFADRNAIIAEVQRSGAVRSTPPTASSGAVQMPFIFRNWVKPGDIVIVSKGNGLFRAIGEVTGEYRFVPREDGLYSHRRDVRWLWHDRVGVPVSEIYTSNFSMKAIYLLDKAEVNVPALERYIASQQRSSGGQKGSFVLIIDEINRANISKVFGELITLLEPDKRVGAASGLKLRLPYSGDLFGVPHNLHVIGTMNTADRSIALLDTALRRRFEFRELMPDASLLGTVDGVDLGKLLSQLNERIEYLFDREHQIGHAYFIGCQTRSDIDEIMRHKVIPLLAEYFYEDWGKVAAVLGDGADGEGDADGGFISRRRLKEPPGLGGDGDGPPRYRWVVRDRFSYEGYLAG